VIAVDLSRSVTKVAMRAQERLNGPVTGIEPAPDEHAETPAPETSAEITAILKKWSGLVDGLVESFRSRRAEPGLFEVMSSAVNIMQDRITRSRLAIDPADLVLHPDLTDFQLMDFHRAREAIAAGRAYVEQSAALLEPVAARLRGGG
jgi:NTE family protein